MIVAPNSRFSLTPPDKIAKEERKSVWFCPLCKKEFGSRREGVGQCPRCGKKIAETEHRKRLLN